MLYTLEPLTDLYLKICSYKLLATEMVKWYPIRTIFT